LVQSAPKAKTCSVLPALLEAALTPRASYFVVGRSAEIGNEAAAHDLALDPYYERVGWVRIGDQPEALALFFMHKHVFRSGAECNFAKQISLDLPSGVGSGGAAKS